MPFDRVNAWLLLLNNDLEGPMVEQIERSSHDMVVLDFLPSQLAQTAYPMAATVARLKRKPDGGRRLVVAYLNVGQAEDYRSYWGKGWRVGRPAWILGDDPNGWQGNFPVAYWRPEWRAIVGGLAREMAAAGFDAAYLDWVGGFEDDAVIAQAKRDGVDAQAEMAALVAHVRAQAKSIAPGFRLIGQNAATLLSRQDYVAAIDAVAQESIWYTWGGGEGGPEGDCPVPRTHAEAESQAFVKGLPPACRRARASDRFSQMRFAGEEAFLPGLRLAQAAGKTIFTVDYAMSPSNRQIAASKSRALSFVPFLGRKNLSSFEPPAP
jgi:cysteinyl-tRNA synthetase